MDIASLSGLVRSVGASPRPATQPARPATPSSSEHSAQAEASSAAAQDIKQAVRQINREITHTDRFLDFSVDKETGISVVKVIDRNSKQVVEQFPAEEIVQAARALGKFQGLFVRQKA